MYNDDNGQLSDVFNDFCIFCTVKIDIRVSGGPQMSSEGSVGSLGVLGGSSGVMDSIAYGCSRGFVGLRFSVSEICL